MHVPPFTPCIEDRDGRNRLHQKLDMPPGCFIRRQVAPRLDEYPGSPRSPSHSRSDRILLHSVPIQTRRAPLSSRALFPPFPFPCGQCRSATSRYYLPWLKPQGSSSCRSKAQGPCQGPGAGAARALPLGLAGLLLPCSRPLAHLCHRSDPLRWVNPG
jgi:hypothetical protein